MNETVQFTIEAVQKYTHLFWAPPSNINFNNLNTSSCFDHKLFQSNSSNKLEFNNISYPNFNDNLYASITLDLYPTNKQHCILQGWFLVIIKMYNITIKLLKSNLFSSKIQKLKRLIQLEKQYKPDFDRLSAQIKAANKKYDKYMKLGNDYECDDLIYSINSKSIKLNDLNQKLTSIKKEKKDLTDLINNFTSYTNVRTNY